MMSSVKVMTSLCKLLKCIERSTDVKESLGKAFKAEKQTFNKNFKKLHNSSIICG